MSAPTVTYWQIQNTGSGSVNLNTLQRGTTGDAIGTALTSSPLDFGAVEAGMWSIPLVFAVEFNGNTAQHLNIKLYDVYDQQDSPIPATAGGNIVSGSPPALQDGWDFRILLATGFTDPTTITSSTITASPWQELPFGASTYDLSAAFNALGTGNDSTSGLTNLLTDYINNGTTTDTTRHLTNFFIYVAAKPGSSASAGTDIHWGFRLSYIYP